MAFTDIPGETLSARLAFIGAGVARAAAEEWRGMSALCKMVVGVGSPAFMLTGIFGWAVFITDQVSGIRKESPVVIHTVKPDCPSPPMYR